MILSDVQDQYIELDYNYILDVSLNYILELDFRIRLIFINIIIL